MDSWQIITDTHIAMHWTLALARMGTDTDKESYSRAGCSGVCRRDRIGSSRLPIFYHLRRRGLDRHINFKIFIVNLVKYRYTRCIDAFLIQEQLL